MSSQLSQSEAPKRCFSLTREVVSLHVLQPNQCQGIGRALIAAIAAKLKRRGIAHSEIISHNIYREDRKVQQGQEFLAASLEAAECFCPLSSAVASQVLQP